MRHQEKAVDIRLRDERYRRLVIEVDDPVTTAEIAEIIENAIRLDPTFS